MRFQLSDQPINSLLIFAICVLTVGCFGRPPRIKPPKLDPEFSAAEAMKMYDTDQDGLIAGDELDAVPAFKRALEKIPDSGGQKRTEIDTDGDGALSEAEIADRIHVFVKSALGVMKGLSCRVLYKGRPLRGATVTFDPEPFMADYIEAAVGVTDETGSCTLKRPDHPLGGITVGFYKVRLTKPSKSGSETLPARLNTETVVGQEIVTGSNDLAYGLVYSVK